MRQFYVLLTVTLLWSAEGKSQQASDSVKAVINQLFEGMKLADPDMIRSVFADSAILQTTVATPGNQFVVKNEQVAAFASSIAKLNKGDADERIEWETLKIDGPLAIAWTPYRFYYKGSFSHCGVNSFQLVRINGAWKIQYLIDTRRRTGCE
ncbi:MAG: DUF4440 domain-containing protein [Terrimonas sp.]|nr:DUF4440 domain-containing protein [Terrimonas sp.]